MLEKVIFVDRERYSTCSILNPSFLEVDLGKEEYYDGKYSVGIRYLNVQFNNGSFRIYEGSTVILEAVINGQLVEYSGGKTLLNYFDFLVEYILPEVGNTISFPQYLVYIGEDEIEAPEEDELTYSYNVFSVDQRGVSGNLPIELSWDDPKDESIEVLVEGNGVFTITIDDTFKGEKEIEFTATVIGVSPTITSTFTVKVVEHVAE